MGPPKNWKHQGSAMNTIKARPILFSAPMVRALIDGRKTQTRRVVKFPIKDRALGAEIAGCEIQGEIENGHVFSPYGVPGDLLWVRETFQGPLINEDEGLPAATYSPKYCVYRADRDSAPEFVDCDENVKNCWKPSIFMPRWASRITLEIISVRVERLQEISDDDAKAEGAPFELGALESTILGAKAKYRSGFCRLWQSINGAGSWDKNPRVWVIGFKVIQSNIDEVLSGNKGEI